MTLYGIFTFIEVDSSCESAFVSGHLNNGTGPKVGTGVGDCCSLLFAALSLSVTSLFERS